MKELANDRPPLLHPPPDWMTPACVRYYENQREILGFLFFVTNLVTRADDVGRTAAQALIPGETNHEERARLEAVASKEPGPATETLRRQFRRLLLHMILVRSVDNFLSYVSDLLRDIFLTKPEVMRSGDMVRLDAVLRHASMEDLVADLAERRVEQLGYRSVSDLAEYLSSRLGLGLFGEDALRDEVSLAVDIRNLVVHNRGIVNETFRRRQPNQVLEVGRELVPDIDDTNAHIYCMTRVVAEADVRAAKIFGLGLVQAEHADPWT